MTYEDLEIWKDIKKYEGLYQISNLGNIKSLQRNTKNQYRYQIITKEKDKCQNGYLSVRLFKNGKSRKLNIHRLVAEAFIKNPYNLSQVNHINGIKTDNRVENLEWISPSNNTKHAYKIGLIKPKYKPVIQLSKDMQIIKQWDSIKEASETLKINHANIITVCKNNTNRKLAGGFVWKYKEEI